MLEVLKYTNHLNEELIFGKNGIFVNYNELHDYLWNYQERGDKISYFSRGIVSKNVPVVVACQDPEKGIQVINALMEYTERDILAKEPGKIYLGDYYLNCYVIGSVKGDYLAKRGYLKADLRVLTDQPAWIKETIFRFSNGSAGTGSLSIGQNMDYSFDYPVDYTNPYASRTVYNTGFVGSDFRMIIYGECSNPRISIGGHVYEVTCGQIGAHEYLTIDSRKKTIALTQANGSTVNKFKFRNRESYIFEKISSGESQVVWDGNITFDVILYEERSEPKWTDAVPSSNGSSDSGGSRYIAGEGIDINGRVISVQNSLLEEIHNNTSAIGNMSQLATKDKSSLVKAVNEVNDESVLYTDNEGYICQK